ncbi:MAG: FAD-binding oxidoreductase [Acidobacteriaceae bacterium]|nr:FAD-binding oxidoreductase [Acidobacteriaceae bacterium]
MPSHNTLELGPLPLATIEWRAVLGPERVSTDEHALQKAQNTTFASPHHVRAILFPNDVQQVQECLRIASRHRIPIYPVSTGKNWGYTSSAPTSDAVLLNLSQMNRILDFSEELGYVTIEPGVTQGQLYEFLKSRNSRLWIDPTGASPECSLLGNIVERGFGHTRYSDHFAHSCNFEVVLPDGQVIHTGHGDLPGCKTAPLCRWGTGPFADGVFSQSNFGVVTRLTLWLMPAPECVEAFFFRIDHEDDLPHVVDALRPLRMGGTLQSACHIGNNYKVLSGLQAYPWDATGGQTPLMPDALAPLAKKFNFGAWNGSGALYGTKRQVAEARRLVKCALAGKASKLRFLDERRLIIASRFAGITRLFNSWDLNRALELVRPLFGLIQGVPSAQFIKSCYWRKRTFDENNMDPDRDRCGLIWCSPLSPLKGAEVRQMSDICISTVLQHGFEPMISLTLLTERTVGCVVSIIYDRDVPGEDERAKVCHEQLLQRLLASGYYPYRLGIQSMPVMQHAGPFGQFLRRLKNELDPEHILAPGRYEA